MLCISLPIAAAIRANSPLPGFVRSLFLESFALLRDGIDADRERMEDTAAKNSIVLSLDMAENVYGEA